MPRNLLFAVGLFLSLSGMAQSVYELDNSEERVNALYNAVILFDEANALTIEEVLKLPDEQFDPADHENLDFTDGAYWLKFRLKNTTDSLCHYWLETARPVTNEVSLYTVEGQTVLHKQRGGDDFPFAGKPLKNRKNLMRIALEPGQTQSYALKLYSDGESLLAPLFIWRDIDLQDYNYKEQYLLGIYYGVLLFVTLIYFFFYLALKERSFLFYVSYIISLFLLQASLDGLVFEYVFPKFPWGANHSVLLSAGLTETFALLFAREFLKTRERMPRLDMVYKGIIILCGAITVLSLLPNPIYVHIFFWINITGLIASLFIPISIFVVRGKGYRVSLPFAIAFTVLIVGAILFILRNVAILESNLFTEHVFKIFSFLEVILLSVSMADRYRELQREKADAQKRLVEELEEKNRLTDSINIRLEQEVKDRTSDLEKQKEELAAANKDIVDSIQYAQRIQKAILPSENQVRMLLPDSFIMYQPRDIVSGDFYWVSASGYRDEHRVLLAAADCTGHGVPGAFVSIVGHNYLKLSQSEAHANTPAEVLNFLNNGVSETFDHLVDNTAVRDGMDIALCSIDYKSNTLTFAGAKNPVIIIRKEGSSTIDRDPKFTIDGYDLFEIKGDPMAIGFYGEGDAPTFTNSSFELLDGDTIYMFSDGFQDQFGGKKGKKFMSNRFRKLLMSMQDKTMEAQHQFLQQTFTDWMNAGEPEKRYTQIDDVLVVGVRYAGGSKL